RPVLRPDRMLVVELTLQGRVRQVPEVLWFRRQSMGTSVERQRWTLLLPGTEPRGFSWPPWLQHSRILWREYVPSADRSISRAQWARMILRYQLTYGWRHFRKTSTSHAIGRSIDHVVWTKKITKHHYHHAVYNTLIGARKLRGRLERIGRRAIYELLML